MGKHLQAEMANLKKKVLKQAAVVEGDVHRAVRSLQERDADLARQVLDADPGIDQTEVEIEEDCLKILALHQPVAVDLRFIIAVLKMNNDLERVGDLAVNIAERALFLCQRAPVAAPFDLDGMSRKALAMLSASLDALMRLDAELARKVRDDDDEVDELHRQMYVRIWAAVRKHPDQAEALLSYLSASRHLERIADSATNIAEDVIYLVEGEIVRHKPTYPKNNLNSAFPGGADQPATDAERRFGEG
jgi:phosphate transport system protein